MKHTSTVYKIKRNGSKPSFMNATFDSYEKARKTVVKWLRAKGRAEVLGANGFSVVRV